MEFEGEEFQVFGKSTIPMEENIEEPDIAEPDNTSKEPSRPLKAFADEQDLKVPTLRKIIYLLEEQDIVFERGRICYHGSSFPRRASS